MNIERSIEADRPTPKAWSNSSWLRAILALTGVAASAGLTQGATIYADRQITSASCAGYDPETRGCGAGTIAAYRTIGGASGAARPGDIILIRDGVYAEQFRPASGAPENPITYQAYPGESVRVGTGSTSSPGMNLSDRSHLIIEGIRVEDRAWCEARNTHYVTLRNCVFLRNPNGGTTGNIRFISAHFNKILNCTIVDGHDNLCIIDANYNVVEGCVIGQANQASHSVLTLRCGDYNVIRGNLFYNTRQKIAEVYDCGDDTSAVPNSFDSTSHNVFDNNIFARADMDTDDTDTTSNANGIQYGGQEGIIRRNIFTRCNVGLGMQVYSDESLHNENNRVYHNVFHDNPGAGIAIRPGNTNNRYKNNIFSQNGGCIDGCTNAVSAGQIVYRNDSAAPPFGVGALLERNNIIHQTPGEQVIEVEFAASGRTLAQVTASHPNVLVGNIEADPEFENPAATNFQIRASSPMIDAGAFLTQTASAGSGTVVVVQDAAWFYDGFGIPGEQGDEIQFQDQTQSAQILGVDYIAKTLTLDRAMTWTAGQGIALRFAGSAPDIGAFERGLTSTPPFRTSAAMLSGEAALTWPSVVNRTYRVQFKESLSATNWIDLAGDVVATGTNAVKTDTLAEPCRFYRIVELP